MYTENSTTAVAMLEIAAKDLYRCLDGLAGGNLTPNGVNPSTGKTVRQTLEEMRSAISAFLARG